MTREEARKTIRKMLAVTDLSVRGNLKEDMVKACNIAIEALEQEPCENAISREAVCDYIAEFVNNEYSTQAECDMVDRMIKGIQHLPPVKPKTDAFNKIKWLIEQYQEEIEKCEEGRRDIPMSLSQAILTTKIGVYGKVVADLKEMIQAESEETETWNGFSRQITAPKGTFERIWNDADKENDI